MTDEEVSKTVTFDRCYDRNVSRTQRSIKRMTKDIGCLPGGWTKKMVSSISPCRSPERRKKTKAKAQSDTASTSMTRTVSESDLEQKVSLRMMRKSKQVRTPQTPQRGGKRISAFSEKRSIDNDCVPRSNNNDFNLECLGVFLHRSNRRYKILSTMCCRPPVNPLS